MRDDGSPLVYCQRCGLWSQRVIRGLAKPCSGPPSKIRDKGKFVALDRIRKAQHPHSTGSGLRLSDPEKWPLSLTGNQPDGVSRVSPSVVGFRSLRQVTEMQGYSTAHLVLASPEYVRERLAADDAEVSRREAIARRAAAAERLWAMIDRSLLVDGVEMDDSEGQLSSEVGSSPRG